MRQFPKIGSAHRWIWCSSPEPGTEYTDGIVLSLNTHVGHPAQSLFYPWSADTQLSEEQDG
jgi:hypothetical protein